MSSIRKEDIINEDNKILNFAQMKRIMNSGIEDCVFKIIRENEKSKYLTGTGFFCNISSKNIKVLITNNHILDQNFLENEKKLKYIIDTSNKKLDKEIDLEIDRYKFTDIDLDFTIIEILPEDNITKFLEIDDYINSKDYQKESIFSIQYPKGKELKISMGEYKYKDEIYFAYSIGTESGTSGSPIILYDNMKIIGLHKGTIGIYGDIGKKTNIGIPFNYIINKINFIKCIYNVTDTQNEICLINNRIYNNDNTYEINKEIESKMKININGKINPIIFKTKINKTGKISFYFTSNETIENLSQLFFNCQFLEEINLSSFNGIDTKDTSNMFYKCQSLKKINLASFNTNNVTNMRGMFHECSSLKEINLSSFNTNNVTNMSLMFCDCSSLEEINLSSFNTNNVKNMLGMFDNCSLLKEINLTSFNTNNVIDMSDMFHECSSLKEINLSSFNTNNVTNMFRMFAKCSSLKEINLSSFNTNNLTGMLGMFGECSSLKEINLSSFNTNKITDMSYMFYKCSSLKEINLSSFNTYNVTNMDDMFYECSSLKEINLSSFNTNNVTNMSYMFYNCSSLKEIDLSSFNTNTIYISL